MEVGHGREPTVAIVAVQELPYGKPGEYRVIGPFPSKTAARAAVSMCENPDHVVGVTMVTRDYVPHPVIDRDYKRACREAVRLLRRP